MMKSIRCLGMVIVVAVACVGCSSTQEEFTALAEGSALRNQNYHHLAAFLTDAVDKSSLEPAKKGEIRSAMAQSASYEDELNASMMRYMAEAGKVDWTRIIDLGKGTLTDIINRSKSKE